MSFAAITICFASQRVFIVVVVVVVVVVVYFVMIQSGNFWIYRRKLRFTLRLKYRLYRADANEERL
jgi:hypothetical protein